MLQYSFPFGDTSFQKKIELCKKIYEDNSSEEDTSNDTEEDSIEAEYFNSEISITAQLNASNRNECDAIPYGQGYWSIITPPPRM